MEKMIAILLRACRDLISFNRKSAKDTLQYVYVANQGSNNISQYLISEHGKPEAPDDHVVCSTPLGHLNEPAQALGLGTRLGRRAPLPRGVPVGWPGVRNARLPDRLAVGVVP